MKETFCSSTRVGKAIGCVSFELIFVCINMYCKQRVGCLRSMTEWGEDSQTIYGRETWICGTFSSYTKRRNDRCALSPMKLTGIPSFFSFPISQIRKKYLMAKKSFSKISGQLFLLSPSSWRAGAGRDVANFCAASLPFPRKNTGERRKSSSRGLQSRFSRNNSCLASASNSRWRSMVLPLPSTYVEGCYHVTNQTALAKKLP